MDLTKATKYLVDRLVGIALLMPATPLLLFFCTLIRLESRGNPLLLQERIGTRGRAFSMFRFRVTMVTTSTTDDTGPPEAVRPTRMGRIVGGLRLEWLPQLINVALGEMSFVGPRPVARGEIDSYTPRQARRLNFRPGLTGWAQIHAQASLSLGDQIALDLYYCERFSLWLDVRILWCAAWRRQPRLFAMQGADTARQALAPTQPVPVFAASSSGPVHVAGAQTTPTNAPVQVQEPLPIVVVGVGGHARVVLDAIEKQGLYHVVGLLGEPKPGGGDVAVFEYDILGGIEVLQRPDTPRRAVVALGSGRARESWFETLEQLAFDVVSVVHPEAHIGRDVQVGPGVVVLAGAVVNSGVVLGRGVLVRAGSTLDHDCRLDDFAHVAPGAHLAGDVMVGARSHIGIGACVVPGIQIGRDVLVGAGAIVTQSVPRGYTVVGTPGRTMRRPDLPTERATSAPARA